MRLATILKLAAIGVVGLIVALVAVVKSIDVNQYRQAITNAAKAATGRDLSIRGKLVLRVSLNPALLAEDVHLANAPWGTRPDMLKLDRLQAEIGLLPLLVREVRVKSLVLSGADILLERDAKGRGNWQFAEPAAGRSPGAELAGTPTSFKIGQVRLENARLLYRDATTAREDTLAIERLTAEADSAAAPIGVAGDGYWNGRRFDLSGILGPVGDMMAAGKPYPVKLNTVLAGGLVLAVNGTVTTAKAADPVLALQLTLEAGELSDAARLIGFSIPSLGAARLSAVLNGPASAPGLANIEAVVGRRSGLAITAKGAVRNVAGLKGVELVVGMEGETANGLGRAVGAPVPAAGPVKGSGRLTDTEGGWRLADFKGSFGPSDLSGEAALRTGGRRLRVEARLASNLVDLSELLGARDEPAKVRPETGRLFPDDALPWAALKAIDAEVVWKIERLADMGLVAQGTQLTASLKDGRLALSNSIGAVAGGQAAGSLALDAVATPPQATLSLRADNVGLGEVLDGLRITKALQGGRAALRLDLRGSGNSVRALMASLNGESRLTVDRGTILGTTADLLALDVLRQLAPWTQERNTEMQCLVSRFAVASGMARSEALLFDTTNMTVGGQGSISLATEGLDLTLAPRPKEASLLSLAVPVDIGGTLVHPVITPNRGALIKGVASAAGLASLGPVGLLVPLISAGTSDTNPCLTALAAPARKAVSPVKKPAKAIRLKPGAKAN